MPGLARRLPAHRPARHLLLLRSLHPHRRFDVQPARQVAQGLPRHSLAAADRVAQLPAHFARLAAGSQRLQPPGSGLHRSRGEQEGRHHPRLSAAGCQHAALGDRSLPAQPQLRQRRSSPGKQPALQWLDMDSAIEALPGRDRHLGMGQQRLGRRTRRRDGLRRRRADARNAGGGRDPAAASFRN